MKFLVARTIRVFVAAFVLLAGFLSPAVAWAAPGGSVTLTPSATTAATGDLIDFTVSLSSVVAGATTINSAGILLQWDKTVLALDASFALGVAVRNDPHTTAYLDGKSGKKINDENGRLTFFWPIPNGAPAGVVTDSISDVMEIRDASLDGFTGPLGLNAGNQEYLNYTRTGVIDQQGAVIAGFDMFKVTLRVRDGAASGLSSIKASIIAISDSAGSASDGLQHTPALVNMNIQGGSTGGMAITSGNNQTATVGLTLPNLFIVSLISGGVPDANVPVTFTAPAGATFAATGQNIETVNSDAGGLAISSLMVLSPVAGSQDITVSATGYSSLVFSTIATPGIATAANSTISPSGPLMIANGQTAAFTVNLKDANNNSTASLGGALLSSSGSSLLGAIWVIVNNGDSTATAIYTPGAAGNDSSLQIKLGGIQVGSNLSVTVASPADTIAPIITMNGLAVATIIQGRFYVDAGASATDNIDGDLTSSIAVNNPVNTSVLGIYIVTYDVTDAAGNPATQVKRTVRVIADMPPIITLIGATPVTIVQGGDYNDGGATAIDDVDGNVTDKIAIVNLVNTAIVGSHTVTYNVSDGAGNAAVQAVRIVNVIPVGGAANRGEAVKVQLTGSETVEIISTGEVISNFSSVPVSGSPPGGVTTPFGVLSYTTTVTAGSTTQTVNLSFSVAIPKGVAVYKVDNIGVYTLIPNGAGADQWVQVDAMTIALTLIDGGQFDLDGIANGVIVDPVAVANVIGPNILLPVSLSAGGCVLDVNRKEERVDPLMPTLILLSILCLFINRKRLYSSKSDEVR